jgi:hypothetical protein
VFGINPHFASWIFCCQIIAVCLPMCLIVQLLAYNDVYYTLHLKISMHMSDVENALQFGKHYCNKGIMWRLWKRKP